MEEVVWYCSKKNPLVAMNALDHTIGIWIFNDQGN